VEGGGEDKAQPFQAGLRVKELTLKLHREGAQQLIAPGGPPVDQLGFRNGEGDINRRGLSLEQREGFLKEANIGPVGRRGHGDSMLVNVRDYK